MPGHFFVIDGPDGAGKTTQIGMLKDILPHRYGRPESDFVFTREPGGSPRAELIRALILSDDMGEASGEVMFRLFAAARFDHVANTILPALRAAKVVVCDRFDGSSFAYQIWAQRGVRAIAEFHNQHRYWKAVLDNWSTIILDVDADTARQRLARRPDRLTHFDRRGHVFFDTVRNAFRRYAEEYGGVCIDATRTTCLVEHDIIAAFDRALGPPPRSV